MNRLSALIKQTLAAAVIVLGSHSLLAGWVSPEVSSGEVKVGEWNSNYEACKTYAEQHYLPMIVFFGETGCDYCEAMSKSLASDEYFLSWQTRRSVVLCYKHPAGSWSDDDRIASRFVFGLLPSGEYEQGYKPGLIFYLLKRDGSNTTIRFTGRSGQMPIGASTESVARQLADSADKEFDSVFFPSDGNFLAGTTPAARLEIEYGRTTYVDIPITRTNSFEVAMSNEVVASYGSSYSASGWATWAVNDETVYVRIPTPEGIAVGETVALRLFNEKGTLLDTSTVTCVTTPENNPKNPLWIGAKQSSELAWGEWTMDYDVARAKVSAAEGEAYTLVLVGGSMWCPDCVKVDHYLIDTDGFRQWASEHHVACVAIDVPRMDSDYPSLLTYKTGVVSERYITSTIPHQEQYQSGAGYLSRNMISSADAIAVAARNHAFLYNDTQHGGLCRPENMGENEETQGFRTGIPCLILMRKDGTVAGRIYQFNNNSPTEFKQGYITRLNELIGQVEDPYEEDNDYYATTAAVLSPGVAASAKISATDARDVWRLSANDGSARVSLTGVGPASNVTLRLSQLVDGELVDLAVTSAPLEKGLAVEGNFVGGDVFVTVEAGNSFCYDPKGRIPTDEESLVRDYTVVAELTVIPSESTCTHLYDESVTTAAVEVVSGKSYWIEGLAPLKGGEGIVKVSENVYQATKTGVVKAQLAEAELGVRKLVCRTWTGGEIGFVETEFSAEESKAGVVKVAVDRTSGESGYVTAKVTLRRDTVVQKALDDGRIVWDDVEFRWENGDAAVTNLPLVVVNDILHDDDLELKFDLVLINSEIEGVTVREGESVMTVTILEDDPESPGVLAIASASPAFVGSRTVKVAAGEAFSIGVERVDGATSNVTGYVVLMDGDTELARSGELTWLDRSRDNVQWASFTAPADKAGNVLTLWLVSTGEASIDAQRCRAKLEVLVAEGPSFAEDLVTIEANRRFAVSREVAVGNTTDFDEVVVKKVSGSLPSGLQYGYEKGVFSVSGAPTVAGSFAVTYQVRGIKGSSVVLGDTLRLEFTVSDVTAQLKSEFPSLATTRTYANIMVSDGDHLTGLLTLTVPANGRLSACYRTPLASWSYSSTGWSSYEQGQTVAADLSCTRSSATAGDLSLVLYSDGSAVVTFVDPSTSASVTATLSDWEWSELNSAEAWQGQYTVQMPQTNEVLTTDCAHATGDGYMTMRMTQSSAKRGKMIYAGMLPNGMTVSGSATLVKQDDGRVRMSFLNSTKSSQSPYQFTGAVDIRPNAATEHTSYRWSVKSAEGSVPYWSLTDAIGVSSEFNVYGGYYDRNELTDCFDDDYGLPEGGHKPFGFMGNGDAELEVSPKFGEIGAFSFVDASVTENVPHLVDGAENPDNVSMSFSANTGVLTGSLKVPFAGGGTAAAKWRGVVLPGWGGCSSCVQPGSVAERPFMSGACWFTDRAERKSFRNGCVVTLDKASDGE